MKTVRASQSAGTSPKEHGAATPHAPQPDAAGPGGGASDATMDGPTDAPVAEPSAPARIGRYLVIQVLGRGGMGIVLEAFDPELDRRVALKLLHPERARGAARLRLLREAQALARLSHPNVVQVYDVGMHGDQVFMAMELVRGRTISAWLREQPRPWTEIVERFVAAGKGLRAAHEVGLVHRDFKPQNVLVGDDGRVRVADFGLAGAGELEALPPAEPGGPSTTSYLATPLTATGAVLGTPRYMAPEQHGALEVGPAADQFAFCVALHEAVFGSHPFEGDSSMGLAINVIEGRLVAPPDASGRPKWLLAAIRRGLAPSPAERHPSLDDLLHVLEHEPLRRRRRRFAGVLALLLGLGVGTTAWLSASLDAPCSGGGAALEDVWSQPQRSAVIAAMEGGGETAEVVVQTLDAYAEQWTSSHRAVCLEHRDEAMSSETFDRAMGCLQRDRAALDGVVETVATGAPQAVRAATSAAASLPAPARCRDREHLARDPATPTDPTQAAAVAEQRERLARAAAVHDAGALQAGLDELAEIGRQADVLGHVPLVAERALVGGRLAIDRGDWSLARRELDVALVRALESRSDALAAESAARALFVDVMLDGPQPRDPEDEAIARALVERVGSPPALAVLLANNVGVVRGMSGDREEAVRWFGQALAQADASGEVDPVDHCGIIINVARETKDPAARDALFVRAEELAERWLGKDHEKTLEIAVLRAQHTVDPQQAIDRLTPACARAGSRQPPEWFRCLCHWRLAELHEQLGAAPEARAALDDALVCVERARAAPVGALEYPDLIRVVMQAHAALLDGDPERALVELDRAQQGLQTHAELSWVALDLADVALLRARSLHALGRAGEAIEPLRAAIAAYDLELTRTEDRAPHLRRARATELLALSLR